MHHKISLLPLLSLKSLLSYSLYTVDVTVMKLFAAIIKKYFFYLIYFLLEIFQLFSHIPVDLSRQKIGNRDSESFVNVR